ncbi:hypothetical protein HXX76_016329, partial [Chlamydomonas incerta]
MWLRVAVAFAELLALLGKAKSQGMEFVWIRLELRAARRARQRQRRARRAPPPPPAPWRASLLASAKGALAARAAKGSVRGAIAAPALGGILGGGRVAGRGWLGRVWTLAERMGAGRPRRAAGQLDVAGDLAGHAGGRGAARRRGARRLRAVPAAAGRGRLRGADGRRAEPLAAALKGEAKRPPAGAEERLADAFEEAVGAWHSTPVPELLAPTPSKEWLQGYLEEPAAAVHGAWSPPDRVWAVYSWFGWKEGADYESEDDLMEALQVGCAGDGGGRRAAPRDAHGREAGAGMAKMVGGGELDARLVAAAEAGLPAGVADALKAGAYPDVTG